MRLLVWVLINMTFLKKDLFILMVCACVLCLYLGTMTMPGTQGDGKRMLGPLEPELQDV